MTSAYMNLFEIVCAKCSSQITTVRTMNETMFYSTIFNKDCRLVYFHRLNYIIHVHNKTKIQCVLRGVELEKVLPRQRKAFYEQYCVDK